MTSFCLTSHRSPIGKLIGHSSAISFIVINFEENTILSVSSDSTIKASSLYFYYFIQDIHYNHIMSFERILGSRGTTNS